MTAPKAIAIKHDKKLIDTDILGTLPVNSEMLAYSEKYKGYKMMENLQLELAFLGDVEDYLNTLVNNNEAIREKYSFGSELIQFNSSDVYHNLVFDGVTIYGYSKKSESPNLMPHGIYSFAMFDGYYPGFVPISINLDEYVKFDNSELEKLQKTIIDFYKDRKIFEENKTRHKGASLIYGSPGQGKSTALMNLISSPEFKNKYVIFVPKNMSFTYLESFKETFDGHDTLIIMEEMTERLGKGTEDILNFLDGYASWNNCYVIATTNYPEVLPVNLVDRPGRFNHLVEVKSPSDEQKIIYFTNKGFSKEEITEILPKTKDFSMDYVARLALESKLQKLPLADCLKALEDNKKKVKSAFKGKPSMGFQ